MQEESSRSQIEWKFNATDSTLLTQVNVTWSWEKEEEEDRPKKSQNATTTRFMENIFLRWNALFSSQPKKMSLFEGTQKWDGKKSEMCCCEVIVTVIRVCIWEMKWGKIKITLLSTIVYFCCRNEIKNPTNFISMFNTFIARRRRRR